MVQYYYYQQHNHNNMDHGASLLDYSLMLLIHKNSTTLGQ